MVEIKATIKNMKVEDLKMCKKMTVAYGDYIGSRMVGWCVFNGKDYSFISDKTVKTKINAGGLVNGLTVDADGNVAIDKEFTKMLMGKSGLTFKPITAADDTDDDEIVMNKYYALVKVVKSNEDTKYHFITNRCGYEIFSEEQLKAMLAIVDMGGIKMGSDGGLMIHKGVEQVDANGDQNKPQGGKGKEAGT